MKKMSKHFASALIILTMIFVAFASEDSSNSKSNSNSSSGPKTEFSSKDELSDYIKYYNYSDLAKLWGEADYKSEPRNTKLGTSIDEKDFEITCRWNKIKVSGCNTVELTFDGIRYSWGGMGPHSFIYYDCK